MSSSSSSSSALNASIDKPGSVGKWGLSGLRSIESNLEESNLEEPSGPAPAPTRAAPRLQQPVSELMSGPVGIKLRPPGSPERPDYSRPLAGFVAAQPGDAGWGGEQAGHRQEIPMEW
jgi:hypothetical protein